MRRAVMVAFLGGVLAACKGPTVPVDVTGYNHTSDQGILGFSVNRASGPNLFPESGGGKSMCCIEIPERWKPGMKAHVKWVYGSKGPGTPPPPPPQEAIVEIPEYTPQNLGSVQVHFYADHRVKVVVSRYSLGHPLYPLPKADWAPWTLNEAWDRNFRMKQATP